MKQTGHLGAGMALALLGVMMDDAGAQTYRDSTQPVEVRVQDLLDRMTLHEKVAQLWQVDSSVVLNDDQSLNEQEGRRVVVQQGAGSFLTVSAEPARQLQLMARGETRLGIPLLFSMDAIHGHALYRGATVYPVPLAMASSWNPALLQDVARATAEEASATLVRWNYSPVLDVARDPRWGRIVEGFGEDPVLVGALGAAMVQGYQGDDLGKPDAVLATGKHFAAYSQTMGGRDYSPADISERTLREIFLPPFEQAVGLGVGSIMASFNEINGTPSTANAGLLRGILKGEWAFPGLVVSDYNSVSMLYDTQYVAATPADAAALALGAGNDIDMVSTTYLDNLPGLVRTRQVPQRLLDDAVGRLLRIKFMLGLFDEPTPPQNNPAALNTPEHRALAREAARQSLVLLKNDDNLLPLENKKRIAVIGPLANSPRDQNGGWSNPQPAENIVTVLQGIRNVAPPGTEVLYAQGTDPEGQQDDQLDVAVTVASQADVVVMVLGEPQSFSSEPNSRASLDLPGVQQELLQKVWATGVPVVLVLMNGRPLTIEWAAQTIPAIVESWFPGEEGGVAIAEALFGQVNPSGKLAVTFPRTIGQVPLYYWHYPQKNWDHEFYNNTGGGPQWHYVYFQDVPLFPFGFGLSYTTFAYENMKISPKNPGRDGKVTVSFDVVNTGKRAGTEIAQLYLSDLVGSVTTRNLALKRFARLPLEPGERRTVQFTLGPEDMAIHNAAMDFVVEPGDFEVYAGPMSTGFPLKGSFQVSKEILVKAASALPLVGG